MRHRDLFFVGASWAMMVTATSAHTLSVSRGQVLIAPDAITINLEVPAEDFLHLSPPSSSAAEFSSERLNSAARNFLVDLPLDLHVWNVNGEKIPLSASGPTWNEAPTSSFTPNSLKKLRATYHLSGKLDGPQHYLVFRQTVGSANSSLRSQYAMFVRIADSSASCTMPLTNGGNVEILELHWPQVGSAETASVRVVERLKFVQAAVRVGDAMLELDIEIPLPLLETWEPIHRQEPDVLSAKEQIDASAKLKEIFESAAQVSADSRRIQPTVVSLCFLSPDEQLEMENPARHARGAWAARAACRMRFAMPSEPRLLEIEWRLFNNAVLSANAQIRIGDQTLQHTFTTYTPKFRWSAESEPRP